MEPVLLSTKEAAAFLSISPRHFSSLQANGRLAPLPVKLGSRVLWSREELEAWAAARCPAREKWETLQAEKNK